MELSYTLKLEYQAAHDILSLVRGAARIFIREL